MHIEQLVKMANDIGNYFDAEPDRESAIEGIAEHIRKFWDPRMRAQIAAHLDNGGAGMNDSVKSAVSRLRQNANAA